MKTKDITLDIVSFVIGAGAVVFVAWMGGWDFTRGVAGLFVSFIAIASGAFGLAMRRIDL